MRRRYAVVVVAALVLALVVATFAVEPALAGQGAAGIAGSGGSGSGSGPGANLGKMLRGIAQPLMFGIAAIMGVGALVKRDFGFAMGLVAILVVVGGFVVAPNQLLHWIDDIWTSVLKNAVIEWRWPL